MFGVSEQPYMVTFSSFDKDMRSLHLVNRLLKGDNTHCVVDNQMTHPENERIVIIIAPAAV
jgi:hypothetical protein